MIVVLHLRRREIKLVGGFNVRNLFEESHQLWEVKELGKTRPCAVAGALRGQLQCGGRFTKAGSPAVEMPHAQLLEPVILQIALDGIELRHRVGNGRAGCKDDTASTGQLVHIAALGKHIRGLLRVRGREPGHIAHLGVKKEVLVVVALIDEHPVNAELFKGDNIVFLALRLQLFQPGLQGLFRFFHLFDGILFAALPFHFLYARFNVRDLFLQQTLLSLLADRDLLKL